MELSDFAQGSALSLLSAALGYWAGFLQKARQDRRRKKSVATALLTELRPLERMLRKMASHTEAASSTVRISMEVYDGFQGDIVLFDPDTTGTLLELRGYIRDLEVSRKNIKEGAPAIPEAHHYFRVKAAMAAKLIPGLRKLLESAGGVTPLDPPLQFFKSGEMPSLPPPAFPEAVADIPIRR